MHILFPKNVNAQDNNSERKNDLKNKTKTMNFQDFIFKSCKELLMRNLCHKKNSRDQKSE